MKQTDLDTLREIAERPNESIGWVHVSQEDQTRIAAELLRYRDLFGTVENAEALKNQALDPQVHMIQDGKDRTARYCRLCCVHVSEVRNHLQGCALSRLPGAKL